MRLRHWLSASACRFDNNARKMVGDLSAFCGARQGRGDDFFLRLLAALNRQQSELREVFLCLLYPHGRRASQVRDPVTKRAPR